MSFYGKKYIFNQEITACIIFIYGEDRTLYGVIFIDEIFIRPDYCLLIPNILRSRLIATIKM